MSWLMTNLVWQHFQAEPRRKLLALKLADNADENGCNIFPSVETMAEGCNCSPRSIQRWLNELADGGLILRVKHVKGGRGMACVYRINPDFIKAHDVKIPHDQRPKWEFKHKDAQTDEAMPTASKKGDSLSPFTRTKRVTAETIKGDTAVSQKGDTAVSPQQPLTVIEPNTPLPPTGGETAVFDLNDLLTRLIEAHGRHSTSDTTAAHSALRRIAPDPASSERMLRDLAAEASSPQWCRDDGRFRPRLSKWLRGWRSAIQAGLPTQAVSPPSQAEVTRAQIAAMGAGTAPPSPEVRERLRQLSESTKAAVAARSLARASAGGGGT